MNADHEHLLDVGAGAFLTLLEGKKATKVQEIIGAYRVGSDLAAKTAELSVLEDLISSFKQRLNKQQAKGATSATRN